MNKYLLSVIVPTRNRIYTLSKLIQLFKEQQLEGVELVIQDNSDCADADTFFNSNTFPNNVSIYRNKELLSFVKNFSLGVENAKGEYLICIGDDDSILPNIMNATKYAKEHNVDCIVGNLSALYFWPGSLNGSEFQTGKLIFKDTPNSELSYCKGNIKKELDSFFRRGCLNYLDYDLPKIYHGIVKKEKMNELKTILGDYFIGLTPDMSSCVGLSLINAKTLFCKNAFTISGIAKNSGSSASGTGNHEGELKNAPHFKGHNKYKWDPTIPDFYSVETIWAETALKTASKFPSFNRDLFNVEPLLYQSNKRYFKYFSHSTYYKSHEKQITRAKGSIFIRPFIRKCISRLKTKHVVYGVENIIEANYIMSRKK